MRKTTTLFFCIISLAVTAQKKHNQIGFEAGFNYSSLRGNDFINEYHDPRFGYACGVIVELNFKDNVSLRSGIGYELKGSLVTLPVTDENGLPDGNMYFKENFDYLNVPLYMRVGFGRDANFFINLGPYIGYLLKETEYVEAKGEYPKRTTDLTPMFKKTELGFSAGFGYKYPIKQKFSVLFELRDNLGLSYINKGGGENDNGIKTNSINLLVGISFKPGQ
jgi:hypothetical protein